MKKLLLSAVLILFGSLACPAAEDWPTCLPADAGVDASKLADMAVHIEENLPHVRSVLVARHGRLIFEGYYGGGARDQLQNLQSMTKSVTSALLGIALKQKRVASLDAKVVDYFPEFAGSITDRRMRDITIRHLLTMSSG